jgi:hypothetical protein
VKTFKQYLKGENYPKIVKHENGATIKHDLVTPETLSTFYVSKGGNFHEHEKAHKTNNEGLLK